MSRNAAAQRAKGARIRAAEALYKQRVKVAEAIADAGMAGPYRVQLEEWRKAQIEAIERQAREALAAAFPEMVAKRDAEVAAAATDRDCERAAAEAEYEAFCKGLHDEKAKAAREAGWRQDRADYLDGKQVIWSLAEFEDNNRYRVERGLRTPQEAQAELVLHARRSLFAFRDVLERDGEVARAEQIVRDAGFEP